MPFIVEKNRERPKRKERVKINKPSEWEPEFIAFFIYVIDLFKGDALSKAGGCKNSSTLYSKDPSDRLDPRVYCWNIAPHSKTGHFQLCRLSQKPTESPKMYISDPDILLTKLDPKLICEKISEITKLIDFGEQP